MCIIHIFLPHYFTMEQSSEITSKQSPIVETFRKKIWEAVAVIPVKREWADKMHAIANQMTARTFRKAKEFLHNNAERIGATTQVAGAVVDVATAVACGAGVFSMGREMKNARASMKRITDHPELYVANKGQMKPFAAEFGQAKKNALLVGTVGTASLVARPASRILYLGAKWGLGLVERTAGAVNAIFLRSEKQLL